MTMKLKEYIAILQQFDPEVEVLKRQTVRGSKLLLKFSKTEIQEPHPHFCYDMKSGKETLIDAFVI